MKNRLQNLIIRCFYNAIEVYVAKHRFAMRGQIEITPMTEYEFNNHLLWISNNKKDVVKDYLNTPTTVPQSSQHTNLIWVDARNKL